MTNRQNPFPVPTPFEVSLLKEMVDVAAMCYERGWSWGTAGNFSVRSQCSSKLDKAIIWQSPSGACKGRLNPKNFAPIDLNTEGAFDKSTQHPSLEMPVHAGIYKHRADAKCVVHTHPFAVLQLSRKSSVMKFHDDELVKALGCHSHCDEIIVNAIPNATPEQMKLFSGKVTEGIGPVAKVLVLAGHGVWAWGKTPFEALAYVEALEILCRQQL